MDQDELKLSPLEPDQPQKNETELEREDNDSPPPDNEPAKEQPSREEQPPKDERPPVDKNTAPVGPKHVLPPKRYKLKTFLMFIDILAIVAYIYYLFISDIIRSYREDTFSFGSNQMFAFYCVIAITVAAIVFLAIFKLTKSAKTRLARNNEVRRNQNIKVWLTGFDWGWPILFMPTMVLMFAAGVFGLILKIVMNSSDALPIFENVIGGIVFVVAALNAAVVIFKLKPVVLGLLTGSLAVLLLILLLHGPDTFIAFFKSFKHLGIDIEPRGYILLAYVWSIFLRIIWVKSLFFYWVFLPNRLELQHGLSESNDSIDRDELRLKIDTDDVILRWWNVGIITFYFPDLDRLPITNVIWGIRKKAIYANRIASVKTMSD